MILLAREKLNRKTVINAFLALLFVCLILMRDVFGVSINSNVFIALPVVFFIINDINLLIAAMVFLIPLCPGIPYVTVYLIGIMVIFIKEYKDMRFSPLLLVCVLLLFILEAFLGFNIKAELNLTEIIRLFGIIFLSFLVLPSYRGNENDYALILKSFLWGFFVMVVAIISQYLSVYSLSDFLSLGIRVGNVASFFKLDPGLRISNNQNVLGILCSTAIYVSLILFYKKTTSKRYIIFIPIAMLFGLLTQSRNFIFSAILILLYYMLVLLFSKTQNAKRFLSSFLLIVILLFGIFFIVTSYFPQYIENLTNRFEVDDLTGGRAVLLELYNEFMRDNPLYITFGAGLVGYSQVSGIDKSTHNGFQQVFVSWGIVGCFIVAVLMYQLYKTASMAQKFNALRLLPFLIYIFSMQFTQWFSNGTIVLLNIVWFYSVRYLAEGQMKNDSELREAII